MKPTHRQRVLPLAASIAVLLQTGHTVQAATLTWDPGNTANGATIDPGSGTWDLSATGFWNNAGTNVAWTQTSATNPLNDAVFGGTDGTYAITVGTALAATRMVFNNSGYTLSAGSAQTITLGSSPSTTTPSIGIASGKSATIGNNVTVTGGGTIIVGAPSGATSAAGTLNIGSGGGGTLMRNGSNSINLTGSGLIVNVNTGGTLSKTGGAAGNIIGVGFTLGSSVTLNVQGGTVSAGSATPFNVGVSGQGTVTMTSGLITLANTTAGVGGVTFGSDATNVSSNVFNLDGGTLTTLDVHKGLGTGSTATFYFNGGILKAAATTTTFMQGLDFAYVKAGGAKIDTQATTSTIAQNLLTDPVSTGGGLTKSGTGALTLSGTNTFTGATTVSAGLLTLGNSLALQNSALDTTSSIASSSAATGLKTTVTTLTLGGLSGNKDIASLFNAANGYSTVTALTLNPGTGATPSYSGSIADGVAGMTLTKTGIGTQTLTGTNTYTGKTTVSLGTLKLNSLATNSTILADNNSATEDVLINGGTLEITASNQIGNNANINMTSGFLTFGSASGLTETVGTLTISGTGNFTTQGNTFIGTGNTTTLSGGTFTVSSGGLVQDSHVVISDGTNTVNAGGTLEILAPGGVGLVFTGTASPTLTLDSSDGTSGKLLLNNNVTVDSGLTSGTATIGSGLNLANPGVVDLNGATRTFTVNDGGASTDLLVNASIQNSAGTQAGLTKDGAGTMTVSANNTYNGATTVAASGGTLEVTGRLSGTSGVTVNTGGTLLLNSNNSNIVNTAATATLGGGTLKFADNNSANQVQNLGSLTLSVNSTLDFGSGTSGNDTFRFTALGSHTGGVLTISNWNGNLSGSANDGDADRLVFNASLTAINNFFGPSDISFTGYGSGWMAIDLGGGTSFEIVPVPEPATTALIGAVALCGLIGYRERRRFCGTRKSED